MGQTGKDLQKRISQHKYNVRTGQEGSGLFKHKESFDHHTDWTTSKVLPKCKGYEEHNVIESCLNAGIYPPNMIISYDHFKLIN